MHPLLRRQLAKHTECGLALPTGCQGLLDAVSEAYRQADEDRRLIEHSLEEMSRELTERNRELGRQLEERNAAEQALIREKGEQAILIARLEEAHNQLLQSEKMASIGQLAAGVAHEINNPIGFVNSNLGTLEGYVGSLLSILGAYEEAVATLPPESQARRQVQRACEEEDLEFLKQDLRDLLGESREGLTRVKRIVEDLKEFSHVDRNEWAPADLHQGLDSTLNVVNNEIKYKARVIKEYGELPAVECLASQINQVFMNLLVNAAQAIREHGTIVLRTGTAGPEAWVEVQDSGCGIPAENLTRIFDPFFTTKPVGKGTGLGLSLVYGIVQKHGGRIVVRSDVGKGSAFRVYLPIRHEVTAEEALPSAA